MVEQVCLICSIKAWVLQMITQALRVQDDSCPLNMFYQMTASHEIIRKRHSLEKKTQLSETSQPLCAVFLSNALMHFGSSARILPTGCTQHCMTKLLYELNRLKYELCLWTSSDSLLIDVRYSLCYPLLFQ